MLASARQSQCPGKACSACRKAGHKHEVPSISTARLAYDISTQRSVTAALRQQQLHPSMEYQLCLSDMHAIAYLPHLSKTHDIERIYQSMQPISTQIMSEGKRAAGHTSTTKSAAWIGDSMRSIVRPAGNGRASAIYRKYRES